MVRKLFASFFAIALLCVAFTPGCKSKPKVQDPLLVENTVTVTLDMSVPANKLIADGAYDFVDGQVYNPVTPELGNIGFFDVSTSNNTLKLEVLLLRPTVVMNREQALKEMDRMGLQPVNFQELLWVGIQHKQLQLTGPIYALQRPELIDGKMNNAFLGRVVKARILSVDYGADRFDKMHLLAALHNPS